MTMLSWLKGQRRALKKSIKDKWKPLASGKFKGFLEPKCASCAHAHSLNADALCFLCMLCVVDGGCWNTPYDAWRKALACRPDGDSYAEAANHPSVVKQANRMLSWVEARLAEVETMIAALQK